MTMSFDQVPVRVHRCRFVDYLPAAITALALPPLPLPSLKGKAKAISPPKFPHLAIGRANGNIELAEWSSNNPTDQAPQAWVVFKTLSGPYPSKVDTLTFILRHRENLNPGDVPALTDLRLFSTGGGSELLEWDLSKGCIRRTINSNGGAIWSLSANPKSTILALGCEDGSIQLLSTENDGLSHLRKLGKVKTRLLSIAWGPPVPPDSGNRPSSEATTESDDGSDDEHDVGWTDGWLVTGCADSSVRKWDFATGRVTNRLTTDKTRAERTLVWSVCVLGDGTIVSGDSMGIVKFWDSKTCTQLNTFQAHGADVLCLSVSPEGNTVYSSGVDQKTVQFTNVAGSVPSSKSRWIQTSSRRVHSHDVRSLAIWPPFMPLPLPHRTKFPVNIAPVLVSGGLDMSVVLTPAAVPSSTLISKVTNPLSTSVVATFEDSYHRKMGYSSGFSGTGRIKLARKKRLVLSAQDQSIHLWRIFDQNGHRSDVPDPVEDEAVAEGWRKVLEMDLNFQSNIVSCDLSDDGTWIAVSDWYEVKLFKLTSTPSGDVRVSKTKNFVQVIKDSIPLGSHPSTGATVLIFTPDSQKLVICTSESSFIAICHLPQDGASRPHSLRTFDHHRLRHVFPNSTPSNAGDSDIDMDNLSDGDFEVTDKLSVIPAVTKTAVSHDCQWLVTADEMKRAHVYNLDSLQHHCALPMFPHAIQALSFDPSRYGTLVIGLANNTIHVFDVESRTFPDWSIPLCSNLPKRFTHLHDPILGLTFNPAASDDGSRKALFWGFTWMCSIKLDSPAGWGGFAKKRRREHKTATTGVSHPRVGKAQGSGSAEDQRSQTEPKNFTVLTHYRPLLFVDFLDCGEMVVVERPLVDIMSAMPPAFFKPKYGSS